MTHRRHQEDRRAEDGQVDRDAARPTCRRSAPAAPTGHPRPGAGRVLRLDGADQPGRQRDACSTRARSACSRGKRAWAAKIEKAIRESDLGLNPSAQGDLMRVPMPALTEERRKELIKLVAPRRRGREDRGAQHAPRRQRARQEAAQGQGDLRRRRAPLARRSAEADRPVRRRNRQAGRRQGSRNPGGLIGLLDSARCTIALAPTERIRCQPSRPAVPRHIAIMMDGNGRWAKQALHAALRRPQAGRRALVRTVRPAPTAASST